LIDPDYPDIVFFKSFNSPGYIGHAGNRNILDSAVRSFFYRQLTDSRHRTITP
jgi:hypothetical protein